MIRPCILAALLPLVLSGCVTTLLRSHMDQTEFKHYIIDAAVKDEKVSGVYAEVTVGQAIQESAWGQSQLAILANNLFGIKANDSWTGNTTEMWTHEYIHGQIIEVKAEFRRYRDFGESIADHSKFLKDNPRYVHALTPNNWESSIQMIQLAGYATDPNYAKQIIALIRRGDADGVSLEHDIQLARDTRDEDK